MLELFCGLLSAAGLLLGIGLGWWFLFGKPNAEAKALQTRFAGLGVVEGKTRAQIEAVVGPPHIVSPAENHQTNCIWQKGRFLISLFFDEQGICRGVGTIVKV